MRPQWLKVVLFFAFLLFSVFLPFLVRNLDRNPCLLFRTRWLGSYVSRGPLRIWTAANAGWADILGSKSRVDDMPTILVDPYDDGAVHGTGIEGRVAVRVKHVLPRSAEWVAWGFTEYLLHRYVVAEKATEERPRCASCRTSGRLSMTNVKVIFLLPE